MSFINSSSSFNSDKLSRLENSGTYSLNSSDLNLSTSSTYSTRNKGVYGKMVLIPASMYQATKEFMNQHLRSLEENSVAKHRKLALQNAHDPKLYAYHSIKANEYQQVADSKNISEIIASKLTNPSIQRIDNQLIAIKGNKKLSKKDMIRNYNHLLYKIQNLKRILMQEESDNYNRYSSNPFTPIPHTMPQTPASNTLQDFLKTHPNIMTYSKERGLTIDGEEVTKDSHASMRILHYLTKDISGPAPTGTNALIKALKKRGYDFNNFGNIYLKKELNENKDKTPKRKQPEKNSQEKFKEKISNQMGAVRNLRSRKVQISKHLQSTPKSTDSLLDQEGRLKSPKLKKLRKRNKPY